jgi:DHA1 family bicyclomycin/chloramphenicol resistance-like MFS transporter
MVKVEVTAYAAVMVLALALHLAGVDRLAVMLGLLFVGYGALGLPVAARVTTASGRSTGPVAVVTRTSNNPK